MTEPFLGELRLVSFNFAPKGWAMANGQLLPINQNQALFSLLGVQFGGNGSTNFALPNFRGRVAVGQGNGNGLPSYVVGQQGGAVAQTLTTAQIPSHSHTAAFSSPGTTLMAATNKATSATPTVGSMLARSFDAAGGPQIYTPSSASTVTIGGMNVAGTVTADPAGSSQQVGVEQPYLVINKIIALQGIFPSRI